MAGLVPAIHVFVPQKKRISKTWITATSAVMTVFSRRQTGLLRRLRLLAMTTLIEVRAVAF
jgi:CHASE2 domain-containing sensor protein